MWLIDQSELKLNWRLKIRLLFSRSEYTRLQTDFSIILLNVEINDIGLLLKPDSSVRKDFIGFRKIYRWLPNKCYFFRKVIGDFFTFTNLFYSIISNICDQRVAIFKLSLLDCKVRLQGSFEIIAFFLFFFSNKSW